ncbi:MAG TPA: hypothetical protein VF607_06550 [Verrucomicrobiae bacterium]
MKLATIIVLGWVLGFYSGTRTEAAPVKTNGLVEPSQLLRGKVTAVDTQHLTVTVGTNLFQLTPDTRILKDGLAVDFSAVTVGSEVSGFYGAVGDRPRVVTSLRIGTVSFHKRKKTEE